MISELAREIHTLAPDIDREVLEKLLGSSRIRDLTEFGRAVHAEMEALLACARNHADCRDATLYSTTFPCHNCAKHIIAAGVERVVYVEPYPKSKAPEFHDDSIILDFKNEKNADRVCFEPFIGIGPRRFFDLFSMHLGSGRPCIRKDEEGNTLTTEEKDGKLKMQMVPWSYLERETRAANVFNQLTKEMNDAGR